MYINCGMTSMLIDRGGHRKISGGLTQPLLSFSARPGLHFSQTRIWIHILFLLVSLMCRYAIRCKAAFGSTDFSLCAFPLERKSKSHRLKPVLLGRAGPSLPLHPMERANVTNRILVRNS